jgi:hypothetical protein
MALAWATVRVVCVWLRAPGAASWAESVSYGHLDPARVIKLIKMGPAEDGPSSTSTHVVEQGLTFMKRTSGNSLFVYDAKAARKRCAEKVSAQEDGDYPAWFCAALR